MPRHRPRPCPTRRITRRRHRHRTAKSGGAPVSTSSTASPVQTPTSPCRAAILACSARMAFARASPWTLEPARPVSRRTSASPVQLVRSVVRAKHFASFKVFRVTDIIASRHTRFLRWSVYPASFRAPTASILITFTGNARALADDGAQSTPPRFSQGGAAPGATETSHSNMLQPPSPSVEGNRRLSMTPGGTTKVLADLQTGVINARNALENTKAQLRLSQRSVAQLTRQTEDLKEVRERLRLENEGLNNVVSRKERLLQEVRSLLFVKEKPSVFLPLSSWHPGTGAGTESRGRGGRAQSSVKS